MDVLEDPTSALLATLWQRNRPLIEERLNLLDRAAIAAAAGTLDADSREEAADVAHKLAGSLGMYGYDEGTRLARKLELLLDYRTPDASQIEKLAIALRASLSLPASNA